MVMGVGVLADISPARGYDWQGLGGTDGQASAT